MTERGRWLRVFVDESQTHGGLPVYERLVTAARDAGLAGATVLRGIAGFGHTRRVHSSKVLQVAEHVPVVVEIVDVPAKVEAFVAEARAIAPGALIMTLDVEIAT